MTPRISTPEDVCEFVNLVDVAVKRLDDHYLHASRHTVSGELQRLLALTELALREAKELLNIGRIEDSSRMLTAADRLTSWFKNTRCSR